MGVSSLEDLIHLPCQSRSTRVRRRTLVAFGKREVLALPANTAWKNGPAPLQHDRRRRKGEWDASFSLCLPERQTKPLFFRSWSALAAYSPLQVIIPFGDITGIATDAKVMSQREAYDCKWGISHKNRWSQKEIISCYYINVPNTYINVPVTKNKKEKRLNGYQHMWRHVWIWYFLMDL